MERGAQRSVADMFNAQGFLRACGRMIVPGRGEWRRHRRGDRGAPRRVPERFAGVGGVFGRWVGRAAVEILEPSSTRVLCIDH